MAETTVARRYAAALLSLTAEQHATERVATDLARFAKLLGHDELLRALCTPLFNAEDRARALETLLPRLGLHALTLQFLKLVNQKGRFGDVADIVDAFERLADEAAGRVRVSVSTAEPMSAAIEAELRSTLERALGRAVVLTTQVDPKLIGGMVARIGSKTYDSSIQTRLESLKLTLIHAQSPAQA